MLGCGDLGLMVIHVTLIGLQKNTVIVELCRFGGVIEVGTCH